MIVRVPASSANLGPGFDSFGIAWQLYNEIDFQLLEEGGLTISGCEEKYQNEDNLAYRAFRRVLDRCGVPFTGVAIRFGRCAIPVSRGLGSSAALIVAGVTAANALYDLGLTRAELLLLATEVEGHPDNVAPALYGGLGVSAMDGGQAITRRFPISERLCFAALIPPFELSTTLARSVLPQTLPREDAVFNVSHGALLLRAFGDGDAELLSFAMDDRIHQSYRAKLIDGFKTARIEAQECGAAGICISGAGPTILCVADHPDFPSRMETALEIALPGWEFRELTPDLDGARIAAM
ncbi:MAG: homoserine kinase [Oscillospiraceae bacterium]|nr:homoserine kinase [Oscillospiraceae bacterium]